MSKDQINSSLLTKLNIAIENGDRTEINKLLDDSNFSLTGSNHSSKNNPIIILLENDDIPDKLEILEKLIAKGASTNGRDQNGNNILHHLVALNKLNSSGLFSSSPENQEKIVKLISVIATENKNLLHQVDSTNSTPIAKAFESGDVKVAGILLEQGSNPNDKLWGEHSLAEEAVIQENSELQQLIFKQKDLKLEFEQAKNMLEIAGKNGDLNSLNNILDKLQSDKTKIEIDPEIALKITEDLKDKPELAKKFKNCIEFDKHNVAAKMVEKAVKENRPELIKKFANFVEPATLKTARETKGVSEQVKSAIEAFETEGGKEAKGIELLGAITPGTEKEALDLIKDGAWPNTTRVNGPSALSLAVMANMPKVVEALLEKGANPNATHLTALGYRDIPGGSILSKAIRDGNDDIAKLLIKHGANLEFGVDHGNSPLMHAVRQGNTEMAIELLNSGAKPKVSITDNSFFVGKELAQALQQKNPQKQEKKLDKEIDEEIKNQLLGVKKNEDAQEQKSELPNELSKKIEEKINTQPHEGPKLTLKDKARAKIIGEDKVKLERIAKNIKKTLVNDPTFKAAKEEELQSRLQKNIEIDNKLKGRFLLDAVREGRLDEATKLIAEGARVDAVDGKGFSALSYALSNRVLPRAQLDQLAISLLEKGANPNPKTLPFGHKALIQSMSEGCSDEVTKKLIEKGADVNQTAEGGNALTYAAKSGEKEIVEALLKNGAKPNITAHSSPLDPEITAMIDAAKEFKQEFKAELKEQLVKQKNTKNTTDKEAPQHGPETKLSSKFNEDIKQKAQDLSQGKIDLKLTDKIKSIFKGTDAVKLERAVKDLKKSVSQKDDIKTIRADFIKEKKRQQDNQLNKP